MPNRRRGRGRGAPGRGGHAAPDAGRGEGPRAPAAGGVFSRLRLSCPEKLTSGYPMGYCSHKVPITFRGLPTYMEKICHEMDTIKSSSSSSDSDYVDIFHPYFKTNKAVLIKGGLILAELKVHIANGLSLDFYSIDQLHNLYEMAELLPKPLVEYLDCIGTVRVDGLGRDVATPVLAQGSGAPALAPSQLAPLLARLRGGASADDAAALATLPLRWERHGDELRLSDESFDFWVASSGPADAPRHAIRWTDEDRELFRDIISSLRYCKGGSNFIVDARHLSRGMGSPAQFVQTPEWKAFGSYKWFTMTDIDDEHIGKGAAFGFGCDSSRAQASRFTGTLETSYRSGDCSHRRSNVTLENLAFDPQYGTIIPIMFSTLPRYVDLIFNQHLIPTTSDSAKAVFAKAALILAEAKVYFAQKASKHTILHPGQMIRYSSEQLDVLDGMPKWLPKPLAIYLECIGVTSAGARRQEVTPVLAEACGAGGAVVHWTDEDSRLFQATIRSMLGAHLVYTDLTHGQGSPAQFVQCPTANGKDDDNQCYVMAEIDDVSANLGAAFRFGDFAGRRVPPSRLTGSLHTAVRRGILYPNRDLEIAYALSRIE